MTQKDICGLDVDGDSIDGVCDNCPNTPNPGQTDSYPLGGNDCGDACECEGNFNPDEDDDVDGSDAAVFKADFGRGGYNSPCKNGNTCNGDFDCDSDVDGSDGALFKADFGRGGYNNPCPACEQGVKWCTYPLVPCYEADDCDAEDCCGYASYIEVGSGNPLYCTFKTYDAVCFFCNSESDCAYSPVNSCCCSTCSSLGIQESLCMSPFGCDFGCESTCLP